MSGSRVTRPFVLSYYLNYETTISPVTEIIVLRKLLAILVEESQGYASGLFISTSR